MEVTVRRKAPDPTKSALSSMQLRSWAVLDWLRSPHWLIWDVVLMLGLLAWWRELSALYVANASIGAGMVGYWVVWRARMLRELAANGLPDPGWWRLFTIGRLGRKRRSLVRQQWTMACRRVMSDISRDKQGERSTPKLRRLRINLSGDIEAQVFCWETALKVEDLQVNRHTLSAICRAHDLVVRKTTAVGNARLIFQFSDYLDRLLTFTDMPMPQVRGNAVVGIAEDGSPLELRTDKPLLIGGEPGSGKSNDVWAAIGSFLKQGIWLRLYVADPKRQEMRRFRDHVGQQMGRLFVAGHAEDLKDCLAIFKAAYAELDARSAALADANIRKLEHGTEQMPLILLVVDEALDFSTQWRNPESDLCRFVRKARSAYAWPVAMAQYGHASAFGEGRKAFGQRLCHRGERETADTILGAGAFEAGARVTDIPASQPGIGFARDDTGWMVRGKSFFMSDADVDAVSVGLLPAGVAAAEPEVEYAVYRYHDVDGACLYVGISDDPARRAEQHKEDKPWIGEVDWRRWVIVWRANVTEARKTEKAWIKKYLPRYNDQHNRRNPIRIDWRRKLREPEEPPNLELVQR